MLVVGIIGPKASGKDTVARHLAEKYGGRHHSHSEILDDVLGALRIPNTRDNLIKLVALRKTFGEDVLTHALNRKIKNESGILQAITGIRFQNELDNIRNYPKHLILYIDAPLELRYERLSSRRQKSDDQTQTFEQFKEEEQKETEIHIKELGAQADVKIDNTGSEHELFAKIDQVIKL